MAGVARTARAVTVPLPTWQALFGVAEARHAPPLIASLASRPGGRASVRSLTPSVGGLGENVALNPIAGLLPAAVPAV